MELLKAARAARRSSGAPAQARTVRFAAVSDKELERVPFNGTARGGVVPL